MYKKMTTLKLLLFKSYTDFHLPRKMPNSIMDWFCKKVNQKINLGRRPPDHLVITILEDRCLKNVAKNPLEYFNGTW